MGRNSSSTEWIRPASHGVAVTPSDVTDLEQTTRGLYVGTPGDVAVIFADDNDGSDNAVTFSAVPAGAILPISVRRVNSTGTTASDIVALF